MSEATLPETFQHYFDTVLMKERDARIMCCQRLHGLDRTDDRIGPSLGGVAGEFFGCDERQVGALSGWPARQLRVFAAALAEAIGCPHGPGIPLPKPTPRPGPDPGPIATRFLGIERRGSPPIFEVVMVGDDSIEIRFIAEEIV